MFFIQKRGSDQKRVSFWQIIYSKSGPQLRAFGAIRGSSWGITRWIFYTICQGTFHHHDVDKKGYLTKSELRESFRTLGHNPTEQEVWKLLAQVAWIYYIRPGCFMNCSNSGWCGSQWNARFWWVFQSYFTHQARKRSLQGFKLLLESSR